MTVSLVANIARPISSAISTAFSADSYGALSSYGLIGGSTNPDAVIEALFANSEVGTWYDFSDLTTMFQDSGGTTPVTTAGQSIALILDKSGNDNHLTCTSLTLQVVDDVYGAVFAGGGASKGITSAIAFGSQELTVWVNSKVASSATTTFVSNGDFLSNTGRFDIQNNTAYRRASGAWGARGITPEFDVPYLTTCVLDLAGTSQDTENPTFMVNEVQGSFANYGTADTGTGNFATAALNVGSGYTGFVGTMFQVIVLNRVATTTEIEDTNHYMLDKINMLPLLQYTGGFDWQ